MLTNSEIPKGKKAINYYSNVTSDKFLEEYKVNQCFRFFINKVYI